MPLLKRAFIVSLKKITEFHNRTNRRNSNKTLTSVSHKLQGVAKHEKRVKFSAKTLFFGFFFGSFNWEQN